MNAKQKIKWLILLAAGAVDSAVEVNASNVDDLYDALFEEDGHWDAKEDVREGHFETDIKCDWSRHYESKSVAAQLPDGSWVGWTYWYGGGKHGQPQAVEWMGEAYDLECVEEQRMVTVRTFKRTEAAS